MVERHPWLTLAAHAVLIVGVVVTAFPLWMAFVASTHPPEALVVGRFPLVPSDRLVENYRAILFDGGMRTGSGGAAQMMANSFVMAVGITVGKIVVSFLAAFAFVYFRFPGRSLAFFLIFITLMLPVEVRIVPTYDVVANVFSPLNTILQATGLRGVLETLLGIRVEPKLSLLNSYTGLILPLIASATATFLFRQFFRTIPDELVDAAQIDGAGPLTFMMRIVLPLSTTNIAALCVILFIYGWNQYLWPLIVSTEERYRTIVMGIQRMVSAAESLPVWNETMALAMLAMLPPIVVVIALQGLFLKGLVEPEK